MSMKDLGSITLKSRGPSNTERLGEKLGGIAEKGLYAALCGELGGGKTTFVRGLARGLGSEGRVMSPTFVLVREYSGRLPLYHLDYYRLESENDVAGLELGACLERGVVAAEWADKFSSPPGARVITIQFNWIDENVRELIISGDKDIMRAFQKA
jgi:tRNA threonylcarbamoyladenosine biosynthesis protein TsaE